MQSYTNKHTFRVDKDDGFKWTIMETEYGTLYSSPFNSYIAAKPAPYTITRSGRTSMRPRRYAQSVMYADPPKYIDVEQLRLAFAKL